MEITDKNILKRLLNVPYCKFFLNENLKNYLSFKPENSFCKGIIICQNERSLLGVLNILKNKNSKQNYKNFSQIRYIILGNGTNSLFKETFYDGYVIKLGDNFKKIKKVKSENDFIHLSVGAGVNLIVLSQFCKDHELGDFEWAYGIPGSVGGAIIQNAGAFGGEMKDIVEKVKILKDGKFIWTQNFWFSYRNSSFKEDNSIIIETILKFKKSSKSKIENLQKEYLNKRLESQPCNFPSMGSVFKRIINQYELIFPAKLVDNLGLKNVKIGGASVSEKHAGFIINSNNATAQDFIELAKLIETKVKENYNIDLEKEINIIE